MNERISISVEVLGKAINILSSLPYKQVSGVIEEIHKDAQAIAPVDYDDSTHEGSGE